MTVVTVGVFCKWCLGVTVGGCSRVTVVGVPLVVLWVLCGRVDKGDNNSSTDTEGEGRKCVGFKWLKHR